jgi:hypothetical protein
MALLLSVVSGLQAQTRFLDPLFGVGSPTTEVYGANVDVFLQAVNNLELDVYQPEGDASATLRPVVVVFPTGNFLLQYLNRGAFGSRRDSAVVEVIDQVVSRGYVGMVAEYRTGWLAASTNQDIRTSTLLQAAYRGGQDAHTLARYLRKTVVEDGNPMQIDTNRIVYMGLGTGGYVAMTHAFLSDVDEVLADERFYDVNDVPYVNIAVNADPQGTLPAFFDPATMTSPSNIPNHLGYNSTVAMTVNVGGALGDIDWMTGAAGEPITIGYHSPTDIFAPFSAGNVVVPTTGDIVIPGVAGTESIVEKANELGLNEAIASANDPALPSMFSDLSRAVNAINAQYKQVDIDLTPFGQAAVVDLSHDNMFPMSVGDRRTPTGTVSSAFNWMDSTLVRAQITAFNAVFGQEIVATDVINNERLTNPNAYNGAGARLVIDTIMAHFLPRAFIGMNLDQLVSTNDLISNASIGLEVFPNPASNGFTVRTEEGHLIRTIRIVDMNGRVVRNITGVDNTTRFIDRDNLPRGAYLLQLQLDEGMTARKVILE